MINRKRLFCIKILIVGGLCTPGMFGQSPKSPVTVILQWLPQAQFAGFYAAQEKGIYDRYDLEVEILSGGPTVSVADNVESGRAQFGTFFLMNAINRKAGGIELVNIAQVSRRSALALIARKGSGIQTVQDLNGKKIGLWKEDFQDVPMAFFEENHLNVKIIPIQTGLSLFLHGGTDLTNVMWYNEYHTLMNCGLNPDELVTFFMKDYGFDVPEDGIYCLASYHEENPDLCRRFVEATMEGWSYAFQHPDEILPIVIEYMKAAHVPANVAHQRWMLARWQDIILPDGASVISTHLEREMYEKAADILVKHAKIQRIPKYEEFYKPVGKYAQK